MGIIGKSCDFALRIKCAGDWILLRSDVVAWKVIHMECADSYGVG